MTQSKLNSDSDREATEADSTADAAASRSSTRRERRREYLRQYYRANREKAREYQRKYNLAYRKKQRVDRAVRRPDVRHTFTIRDIMQLPTEKAARAIDLICRGERTFTM